MAAALWIAAGVGYLATETVAASRMPEYSYVADYISDLGRPESPLSWWMNAAFRVQGMAFVVAGALTVRTGPPRRGGLAFVVAACAYGAGSVVVGLFPSGGTGAAQGLHVGGAAAAIVGGNLAVLIAAWAGLPHGSHGSHALRRAGYGLGAIGLLSGVLLVAADLPTGVCERGAIYPIIAWQLLAAVAVLTSRPLSTDRAGDPRAGGRTR
ncbi:putative membrane protein [Mycobacterium sp. BK558]|nr:putative membrane protein [Mycobacterium sp. BK558]